MTTQHTHQVVFGRKVPGCPRCDEPLAGAAPVTITTDAESAATPPADRVGCLPGDVAAVLAAVQAAAETAQQAALHALLAAAGTDPVPDLDTDALPWPGNAAPGDVRTAATALLAQIMGGPRGYDAWTHTARLAEWIVEAANMAAGGQGAGARARKPETAASR